MYTGVICAISCTGCAGFAGSFPPSPPFFFLFSARQLVLSALEIFRESRLRSILSFSSE